MTGRSVSGVATLFFLSTAYCLHAQGPAIPRVVSDGLDLLAAGKRTEAVSVWGRSWTGADTAQAATLRTSLEELSGLLGAVRGFDLVRTFSIGENLQQCYIIIRYEKQPLFAYFVVYRPNKEWQVNAVRWNTDAADVFPSSLRAPP